MQKTFGELQVGDRFMFIAALVEDRDEIDASAVYHVVGPKGGDSNQARISDARPRVQVPSTMLVEVIN